MKKITKVDDLVEELVTGQWHPKSANPIFSSDYPGLHFSCGCGSDHALSFTDFIMIGTPVKFVFFCENDYLTGVRVKGMFRQRAIELWTCKKSLYLKAVKKVNES